MRQTERALGRVLACVHDGVGCAVGRKICNPSRPVSRDAAHPKPPCSLLPHMADNFVAGGNRQPDWPSTISTNSRWWRRARARLDSLNPFDPPSKPAY